MRRLNTELDLQSLFGLLCTAVLRPRNSPPPPPPFWAHIRGRYWSAKIDDISFETPWKNRKKGQRAIGPGFPSIRMSSIKGQRRKIFLSGLPGWLTAVVPRPPFHQSGLQQVSTEGRNVPRPHVNHLPHEITSCVPYPEMEFLVLLCRCI
jgi:hypothetical protein